MKFEQALDLETVLSGLRSSFDTTVGEGGSTDEIVDEVIGLDLLADVLDGFLSAVKKRKTRASELLVERFVDGGQESVTRRNRTVFLATEFWPSPRVSDLLPDDVDPNDPQYGGTMMRIRDAAKDRLVAALKSSMNFADLVEETYNLQSLRSALAGKEVERDDVGNPILPAELATVVELNPRIVVRVRKSTR